MENKKNWIEPELEQINPAERYPASYLRHTFVGKRGTNYLLEACGGEDFRFWTKFSWLCGSEP